jgi:hypothetical protein
MEKGRGRLTECWTEVTGTWGLGSTMMLSIPYWYILDMEKKQNISFLHYDHLKVGIKR